MSRTGRRPGTQETRDAILQAARRAFGARGYEATSLRSIARDVGVDPALVVHYFSTKEGLFLAVFETVVRPSEMFEGLSSLSASEAARLIVERYLETLAHEATRDLVLGLVRSAVSNESAARMLQEFLRLALVGSISASIAHPDAELRALLVTAQLIGIAMLRFVIKDNVVVAASNAELVALVAPTIENYLR
ncbi:MAG: TetR family transcriptional regulator [Acidimicrobiales bacterium]|jgi:AcrR family transcriptional regulator